MSMMDRCYRPMLVSRMIAWFCRILDEGSDPLTVDRDQRRRTHADHGCHVIATPILGGLHHEYHLAQEAA